ncbi:cache domain-containing protein [Rhodoferax sp.]|uniref:sensor histidine kinase n=1 Tax=Rhodoferax sp. TaxID=50421 RepID=UPI00275D479F|nr:cache domain-containing protein [Rhodoferax sp.]
MSQVPPTHWLQRSIRNKLLTMALLPLAGVLPLLVAALAVWGNAAYDRLLITKVRSDLAVARGYFDQVLGEVGSGTHAVAASHQLHLSLERQDRPALQAQLKRERERLGFDFINLYGPEGDWLTADWATDASPPGAPNRALPDPRASLSVLDHAALVALAPHLAPRLRIPIVPTANAAPSQRTVEDRAMVMLASAPVLGSRGETLAILRAGVLLNQNLPLIDHINRIVYPEGSLPLDSLGTATLFMDDVRITTNVRLFQNQRAIGTRVSQSVREAVLGRGATWLDSAFVVNDWYVSAYEPVLNAAGERIGMLYVGYLEKPFRQAKYAVLAIIGVIFLVVMALSALFSVRLARSIFQPVERMNATMRQFEEGQSSARVGSVSARDEIGALAAHLDHLLGTVDDKTQALQRWGEELDTKVAERTRELEQANHTLQQAQQQLVKSEKLAAIGQLTASIAHEINNPIAVIQGNLDLMRETLGERAHDVHGEMKLLDEQVERMRLIVTQLLQYARPTEYAGYVEALDVNRVLADSLVLVAHLLANRRIEVRRHAEATTLVGLNRQELQQVVINLLVNAIQAMPDGGTLTLRTRNWAADGPTGAVSKGACIDVQDSGAGLSPAAMDKLFKPFFTTKNDGNGLGLWISQGLVERYGGRITAANVSDGTGACFTIWLLTEPQVPDAATGSTNNGRSPVVL